MHVGGWGDMSNARRNVQRMSKKQKQTKNRGKTKGCITKGDLKLLSYDLSATNTWAIGIHFYTVSSSTVQKKKGPACLVRIWLELIIWPQGPTAVEHYCCELEKQAKTYGPQQKLYKSPYRIFAFQETTLFLLLEAHRQIFWGLYLLP